MNHHGNDQHPFHVFVKLSLSPKKNNHDNDIVVTTLTTPATTANTGNNTQQQHLIVPNISTGLWIRQLLINDKNNSNNNKSNEYLLNILQHYYYVTTQNSSSSSSSGNGINTTTAAAAAAAATTFNTDYCMISCGDGYDILVILNNTNNSDNENDDSTTTTTNIPYPDDISTIPRLTVSLSLTFTTTTPTTTFNNNDNNDNSNNTNVVVDNIRNQYGIIDPTDELYQHIDAIMTTTTTINDDTIQSSNLYIYLTTSTDCTPYYNYNYNNNNNEEWDNNNNDKKRVIRIIKTNELLSDYSYKAITINTINIPKDIFTYRYDIYGKPYNNNNTATKTIAVTKRNNETKQTTTVVAVVNTKSINNNNNNKTKTVKSKVITTTTNNNNNNNTSKIIQYTNNNNTSEQQQQQQHQSPAVRKKRTRSTDGTKQQQQQERITNPTTKLTKKLTTTSNNSSKTTEKDPKLNQSSSKIIVEKKNTTSNKGKTRSQSIQEEEDEEEDIEEENDDGEQQHHDDLTPYEFRMLQQALNLEEQNEKQEKDESSKKRIKPNPPSSYPTKSIDNTDTNHTTIVPDKIMNQSERNPTPSASGSTVDTDEFSPNEYRILQKAFNDEMALVYTKNVHPTKQVDTTVTITKDVREDQPNVVMATTPTTNKKQQPPKHPQPLKTNISSASEKSASTSSIAISKTVMPQIPESTKTKNGTTSNQTKPTGTSSISNSNTSKVKKSTTNTTTDIIQTNAQDIETTNDTQYGFTVNELSTLEKAMNDIDEKQQLLQKEKEQHVVITVTPKKTNDKGKPILTEAIKKANDTKDKAVKPIHTNTTVNPKKVKQVIVEKSSTSNTTKKVTEKVELKGKMKPQGTVSGVATSINATSTKKANSAKSKVTSTGIVSVGTSNTSIAPKTKNSKSTIYTPTKDLSGKSDVTGTTKPNVTKTKAKSSLNASTGKNNAVPAPTMKTKDVKDPIQSKGDIPVVADGKSQNTINTSKSNETKGKAISVESETDTNDKTTKKTSEVKAKIKPRAKKVLEKSDTTASVTPNGNTENVITEKMVTSPAIKVADKKLNTLDVVKDNAKSVESEIVTNDNTTSKTSKGKVKPKPNTKKNVEKKDTAATIVPNTSTANVLTEKKNKTPAVKVAEKKLTTSVIVGTDTVKGKAISVENDIVTNDDTTLQKTDVGKAKPRAKPKPRTMKIVEKSGAIATGVPNTGSSTANVVIEKKDKLAVVKVAKKKLATDAVQGKAKSIENETVTNENKTLKTSEEKAKSKPRAKKVVEKSGTTATVAPKSSAAANSLIVQDVEKRSDASVKAATDAVNAKKKKATTSSGPARKKLRSTE